MSYSVGVLGATGAVGRQMIDELEERDFPVDKLRLFATKRSHGQSLSFKGEQVKVSAVEEAGAAESFGPFFAERVMGAIRSAREEDIGGARFMESLRYAFARVALVAAAVAAFLLIYNLNQGGGMSIAAALGGRDTSIEEVLTAPVKETLEELL